jgi:hypothetical protein
MTSLRRCAFVTVAVLALPVCAYAADPHTGLTQLAQTLGTGAPTNRPGTGGSCYAVCRYKDSAGAEFDGTADTCGRACEEAADKCDKQGQGDCAQDSCETPDCDTSPQ